MVYTTCAVGIWSSGIFVMSFDSMSCAALVNRNPACTLDDVKAAISGHLCRCGTYPNIFAATLAAARMRESQPARRGQEPVR